MLTKKKKLTRKEIKEDKLVSTYYKAYGFFEENKSRILMYAGALAVIIAVVYFYSNYQGENNERAGYLLSKVMPLYDAGSYLEAIEGRPQENIEGLKKIVDDYGSTENGETAKILLANSYNMLGKFDEAFKYYKDFSGKNYLLKATALAGEAGYYEMNKDYSKAASLYKKAAFVSEFNMLNGEYLLKAGINYMKAGDNDEAKNLFEMIKKEHTTSMAYREVEKYLQQIN